MKIMKLLALFWEGGKEGWNKNVATDDFTPVNNDAMVEDEIPPFEPYPIPDYDDIQAFGHEFYHPHHHNYNK